MSPLTAALSTAAACSTLISPDATASASDCAACMPASCIVGGSDATVPATESLRKRMASSADTVPASMPDDRLDAMSTPAICMLSGRSDRADFMSSLRLLAAMAALAEKASYLSAASLAAVPNSSIDSVYCSTSAAAASWSYWSPLSSACW